MEIRELPEIVQKNGEYRRIAMGRTTYIYGQYLKNADKPHCFEVFKRKQVKAHPKDLDQSPKIAFPGNEDFGHWAFTYRTLEEANRKQSVFEAEANNPERANLRSRRPLESTIPTPVAIGTVLAPERP